MTASKEAGNGGAARQDSLPGIRTYEQMQDDDLKAHTDTL